MNAKYEAMGAGKQHLQAGEQHSKPKISGDPKVFCHSEVLSLQESSRVRSTERKRARKQESERMRTGEDRQGLRRSIYSQNRQRLVFCEQRLLRPPSTTIFRVPTASNG